MSASKILVPIGFSEQSIIALGQAFNLAKIKNSDVVLLSVIEGQSMIESLFLDDKSDELKAKGLFLLFLILSNNILSFHFNHKDK